MRIYKYQKDAEVAKLELAAVYDDYEAIKSQVEVNDVAELADKAISDMPADDCNDVIDEGTDLVEDAQGEEMSRQQNSAYIPEGEQTPPADTGKSNSTSAKLSGPAVRVTKKKSARETNTTENGISRNADNGNNTKSYCEIANDYKEKINKFKKSEKELQCKIDYWVESKTTESLTSWQKIVLFVSMIVIIFVFAVQQRLPLILGFFPDNSRCAVYLFCHFTVLVLPAISAAVTSITNITVKRYDKAIELLCEKEQNIFKRSAAYQRKIAWKTITDALTIITTFIAAISLIKI